MKFLLSFVALVSLFAFWGNSENYEIPTPEIDLSTLNFFVGYTGAVHNVLNYSIVPDTDTFTMGIYKFGDYMTLSTQAQGNSINYTKIPFGYYLFRADLKNLYYYPYDIDYDPPAEVTYRCENKGQATIQSVLAQFADYIDLARPVRGKKVFTEKEPYSVIPEYDSYKYSEEHDITDEKYDKLKIVYEYVVNPELYNLTISRATHYYRRSKGGDYETTPYVQDSLGLRLYTSSSSIFEWQDLLLKNDEEASQSEYFMNLMDRQLIPVITFQGTESTLVCPEIDNLPAPSLTELLPPNYTEYQLIFENPVHVQTLVESLRKVLNLTDTYPERVAYSGIEKIKDEWSVDVVMPTDLGEILSVAVKNRDVRKSGYELIGKITKMVPKKSGK